MNFGAGVCAAHPRSTKHKDRHIESATKRESLLESARLWKHVVDATKRTRIDEHGKLVQKLIATGKILKREQQQLEADKLISA